MTDYVTLAGGCFWCTEAVFKDVIGVESVESGYIGGNVPNPTYKQVCGGDTGHAEAIRIGYDPEQLALGDLLDIFFATHDPTQLNRQGNDVGRGPGGGDACGDRAGAGGAGQADRDDGGADGGLVSRGGLPSGLLGNLGPVEPLLHGGDPAEAAETAQELRRAVEGGGVI